MGQIQVTTATGRLGNLTAEDGDTIEHLKNEIKKKFKIDPDRQRLRFSGKELENGRTLADYNIQDKSTIQVTIRRHDNYEYLYDSHIEGDAAKALFRQKAIECDEAVKALIVNFYRLSQKGHMYRPPTFCSIGGLMDRGIGRSVDEHDKGGAPDFRWIHLPMNNISWVERVVGQVVAEDVTTQDKPLSDKPASSAPGNGKGEADNSASSASDSKGKMKAAPMGKQERDDVDAELLLIPLRHDRQHFVSQRQPLGGEIPNRFLKPCYSRVSNKLSTLSPDALTPFEDQRRSSFVFMPYVDWELEEMHEKRKESLTLLARTNPELPVGDKWENLPMAAKLLFAYFWSESPLHDRRTLDQAFYYTMSTINVWARDTEQDGGQVLHRYFQRNPDCGFDPRILMVDQLWIWVIETMQNREGKPYPMKTVITAFPSQWTDKDAPEDGPGQIQEHLSAACGAPDARGRVLSALYGNHTAPVVSAADLVCLVIERCSGLLHPTPQEINDPFDYLDTFAVEIEELASQQTNLSNWLRKDCDKFSDILNHKDGFLDQSLRRLLSESVDRKKVSEVEKEIDKHMRSISDISRETKCLSEIKDVMDELNILSNIFGQQMTVVQSMIDDARMRADYRLPFEAAPRRNLNPLRFEIAEYHKNEGDKYAVVQNTLTRRHESIKRLENEALGVYKKLCDILDLKQKQATVFQAMSARDESKEAKQQGQTLMLFTIITIIFLPLSFIAAIYSMNAKEITNEQKDPPISDIFKVMFPTTAGILIVSLYLAYPSPFKGLVVRIYRFGHSWATTATSRDHQSNTSQTGENVTATDILPSDETSTAELDNQQTQKPAKSRRRAFVRRLGWNTTTEKEVKASVASAQGETDVEKGMS